MFGSINLNEYDKIIKETSRNETDILVAKYKNIHMIIFQYCVDNNIIISSPDILVDSTSSRRTIDYSLYAANPFKHATNLSNKFVEISKFVEMRTQISHQEFVIQIELIVFVKFYILPYTREKNIKFMQTYNCQLYDIDLQFMPPGVELIDIYRQLYTPLNVSNWKKILTLEGKIYTLHKEQNKSICNTTFIKRADDKIINIKTAIFDKWCNDKVLVGHWAYNVYTSLEKINNQLDKNERLQIISDNPIENDILSLELLIKNRFNCRLSYKKQNVGIPKDFRIEKHCIDVMNNGKSYTILEIYNSSSFEIIPYIEINQRMIGNPYVLLRFFMIDYWIIQYITSLGKMPLNVCKNKLSNIIKCTSTLRSTGIIHHGFGKKYTGSYINEFIADKLRRLDTERHAPYLPYVKKRTY